MIANRLFGPSLLLLFGILFAPGAAYAEPSLAEAVKKLDAKYLELPDLETKDSAPKIDVGGGEEEATPAAKEIAQGAVKASLTYIEEKSEDGDVTRVPVVTISADGKEVAKLEGDNTGFADPPSRLPRWMRAMVTPKSWCRSIRVAPIAARLRA